MAERPALSSVILHSLDSNPQECAPPESSSSATSIYSVTTAAEPSPREIQSLSRTVCVAPANGDQETIVAALSGRTPELIKRILGVKSAWNHLSPLALAVYHGHLCVVELLLQKFNVDIDERILLLHNGVVLGTAFSIAAMQGYLDIVKCLVNYGTDVNKVFQICQSALHAACYSGHMDIIQYLLERGARPDLVDGTGSTCLMTACKEDNTEVVKLLLEMGVDSNQKSGTHQTAMHIAGIFDAVASAKLLLEYGATIIKNEHGRTPLVEAILKRSREFINFILSFSAVSRQERVDALELWGAVCISQDDFDEGFLGLLEAMIERFKDPSQILHKSQCYPMPVLDGVSESLTLGDLQSRRHDHIKMMMESVLIFERILYPCYANHEHSYLPISVTFLQKGFYREVLVVWTREWEHLKGYYGVQLSRSRYFLNQMWVVGLPPAFEVIAGILDVVLTDLETSQVSEGEGNFFMVHGLCICLLSSALGVIKGEDEQGQVKNIAKRPVQKSFSLRYPLLYQAIQNIELNPNGVMQLNSSCLVEILLDSEANETLLDPFLTVSLWSSSVHKARSYKCAFLWRMLF